MKKIVLFFAILFFAFITEAQNVGIGTNTPNAAAILDISSSNKGLLIPRMNSTQRNAIAAPVKGLMTFDSSKNSFWFYTGNGWKEIAGNTYSSDSALLIGQQTGSIASYNLIGNTISNDSSGYLYDSGGPSGNYGNNENFQHTIFYTSADQLAIDLTVLSNNLESPYDSLIIFDNSGHRYVLLGTSTGTYRFFSQITIQFKSNFANTLAGFAIRWNGVFSGTDNSYDANQSTGWYYNPSKNYMRGGVNANNNWAPDSSGMYSFAFGNNNKAKGNSSTAMGLNSSALGTSSTAMGNGTTATGTLSTALGNNTTASGASSTAMGMLAVASGQASTAIGYYTNARGIYSIAIGNGTNAIGQASTSMGSSTSATGDYSTAMGYGTTASGFHSTAMGYYTKSKSQGGLSIGIYNDSTNAANAISTNPLNRIFQIGNGTGENTRSNAMTVLYNGNIGIGTTTPAALLQAKNGAVLFDGNFGSTPVSGVGTRMMWVPAKAAFRAGNVSGTQWDDANIGQNSFASGSMVTASGNYSTAMGYNSNASLDYCFALGNNVNASGYASTAIGSNTNATASTSTAMGYITTASGNISTAMGYNTTASGNLSTAMGYSTTSKSFGGLSIGLYNDSTIAASNITFNPLNRIFQIGNGTADNARSNAMTVLQNGNVGIGELSPAVPLNFASAAGNKIALWGNAANHYGMGTQPNLMQFYVPSTIEDIAFGYGNSAAFTENMRIKGNGNVGIGTAGPTAKLSVNGTANNATGNWGVFSDARVKTITGNFTDGLNVINQINPIIFNYNDNAPFKISDNQIGIVAQDLEKIAPYMVSKQAYNQFTDLREVNNQAYVFLLINAVKEQQLQLKTQQTAIAEQKQHIDKLEKIVTELSQKMK